MQGSGATQRSFEIISETHMDSDARARRESTAKYTEREGEILTDSITAADLPLQLATAQVEVVGNAAKQFDAQF